MQTNHNKILTLAVCFSLVILCTHLLALSYLSSLSVSVGCVGLEKLDDTAVNTSEDRSVVRFRSDRVSV